MGWSGVGDKAIGIYGFFDEFVTEFKKHKN